MNLAAPGVRPLATIDLPRNPGLALEERRILAETLRDLAVLLGTGRLTTGTVIVPGAEGVILPDDERRCPMKIVATLTGPKGVMHQLTNEYFGLPPEYEAQVREQVDALAKAVQKDSKPPKQGQPAYGFTVDVDGTRVAVADGVAYSAALKMQQAGLHGLQALIRHGADEVERGERG